jgi:hypothetical protein
MWLKAFVSSGLLVTPRVTPRNAVVLVVLNFLIAGGLFAQFATPTKQK